MPLGVPAAANREVSGLIGSAFLNLKFPHRFADIKQRQAGRQPGYGKNTPPDATYAPPKDNRKQPEYRHRRQKLPEDSQQQRKLWPLQSLQGKGVDVENDVGVKDKGGDAQIVTVDGDV